MQPIPSSSRPAALTIAGSDSSGGAGIQADLKTFSALGVYGVTVITAVTAQNTRGVQSFELLSPEMVGAQLASVLDDVPIRAVKTGMLGNARIIAAVSSALRQRGLRPVVDPVMVATSGDLLMTEDAVAGFRDDLIQQACLVTPNLDEAAVLLGTSKARDRADMAGQARALLEMGCKAVLMKGGHLEGMQADDLLATPEGQIWIEGARVATRNTHGTGCTLSAAITAELALGAELEGAVRAAKGYLYAALNAGQNLHVGSGSGPVDHLYAVTVPH